MNRKQFLAEPSDIATFLTSVFDKDKDIIIFDIGACEGLDTIKYSRLFPNAHIYAFEPVGENVELIEKHLEEHNIRNIVLCPYALDETIGHKKFYVSSGIPQNKKSDEDWTYGNKSSSLLAPKRVKQTHPWLIFDKEVMVKTITLDFFAREHAVNNIDFIHLDVQGAELAVLRGGKQALSCVKLIWLEVETIELYENQPLRKDVENFMFSHGFVKIKDTVEGISGDQLYANKRYFRNGFTAL